MGGWVGKTSMVGKKTWYKNLGWGRGCWGLGLILWQDKNSACCARGQGVMFWNGVCGAFQVEDLLLLQHMCWDKEPSQAGEVRVWLLERMRKPQEGEDVVRKAWGSDWVGQMSFCICSINAFVYSPSSPLQKSAKNCQTLVGVPNESFEDQTSTRHLLGLVWSGRLPFQGWCFRWETVPEKRSKALRTAGELPTQWPQDTLAEKAATRLQFGQSWGPRRAQRFQT